MKRKIEQELLLERFEKDISALTADDRLFLVGLNQRLAELEPKLKTEVQKMLAFGAQRAGESALCNDCIEVEWEVQFFIGEDDPAWDDEHDNILAKLWSLHAEDEEWTFGVADGENHNEFQHIAGHPFGKEFHCWLYHCLYDHVTVDQGEGTRRVGLDWGNILRIDGIRLDLKLWFQGSFDINRKEIQIERNR